MQRRFYGARGRPGSTGRRGAPPPPRRKKKSKAPPVAGRKASAGFEFFLAASPQGDLLLPAFLPPAGAEELEFSPIEKRSAGLTQREGFLVSSILHLVIFIVLILKPELLRPGKGKPIEVALARPQPFMLVDMNRELAAPKVAPPSPQQPPPGTDAILIPKATQPPPPEKRLEFQNDLPFSEGNTDEFYTNREPKKPGEEGERGEEKALESEQKVAELSPDGPGFSFPRPQPERPRIQEMPPPGVGQEGEGGAFEDLQRFLRDKQFHNPEGGLVTGHFKTLYYNDRGANLVPWLRRMLAEVERNWRAIIPYSVTFQAGHVAVGVSVLRNGGISEMKVLIPSGTVGFDNAAWGALRAAVLLPLPSDYPDQRFDFILVFWYNERPYDLF